MHAQCSQAQVRIARESTRSRATMTAAVCVDRWYRREIATRHPFPFSIRCIDGYIMHRVQTTY